MGKKSARQKAFGPTDYNQPTEPVKRIILPPSPEPTAPLGGWYVEGPYAPSSQAEAYPYPQEYAPTYPYAQPPAYPMLPPVRPKKYRGQPPGGSAPMYQPFRMRRRHRSPLPGLVGLCLMLVQLVLLIRVICLFLGVVATTFWLNLLFVASDVLVEPLRWLATTINIGPLAGTPVLIYIEFLLAILAYGIFSRLLVGVLKVLFRS
jgi:hypothetical protein